MRLIIAVIASVLVIAVLAALVVVFVLPGEELPEIFVAIEAEPITLDPFSSVDHISPVVQQVIFEGLLRLGTAGEVLPSLATDYSIAPDARSITFTLRRNVRFHDGSAFDAAAVRQNFEFLLDPENEMARRYLFDFVESIVVNGSHSITFQSNRADYALAYYFAHPAAGIKSAQELDKRARDPLHNLTHTAVGTGPFRLILWHGRKYIELEPNPYYWDEAAAPQTLLRFLFVEDPAERLEKLRSGEIQAAFPAPPPTEAPDPAVNWLQMPLPQQYFVGINLARTPLSDARVRQAMNLAVNRAQLRADVGLHPLPLGGPASPAIFGAAATEQFPHDPLRAKELLAAARWTPTTRLGLLVGDRPAAQAIGASVQRDLAAVGIAVDLETVPEGDLLERLEGPDVPDLWLRHWRPYSGEIGELLATNFALPGHVPHSNNVGNYRNPDLDVRLDSARQNSDTEAALADFAALQATIRADAPWIFLFAPMRHAAYNTRVTGIEVAPNGALRLSGVRFAR